MRRILMAGLVVTTLGASRPATAQTREWSGRTWFSVSGGAQPAVNSFDDRFDLPLNAETGSVATTYPVQGGVVIAASGGVRVWKQLAVGLGLTRYNRRAQALIEARLPHPFFDNQFREIEGATGATRRETGAHLMVGWMVPVTQRLRVLIAAGPSVLGVSQTVVSGVQFAEAFPYDSAAFTGATTLNASTTATGFNAGADVFWMFSRHLGAGGLAQVTRARARLPLDGRSMTVDAGGAQAAGGIRLLF